MTTPAQHAEWLALVDISGPFLAEPVLKDAFPQGLEDLEATKRKHLRQAYDEWREALEVEDPDLLKLHAAWIDLVLRQGLELDEDGEGDVFKSQADLPEAICCKMPEQGITLRPDYAVVDDQEGDEPLMLVAVYEPIVPLDEPIKGDGWAASPAERMVELCRATGVRLGLLTNGERWMFVDAPVGAVTTFASWYARLWGQEPKTLQAFVNLLGVRRFFVDRSEQLPALLDESLKLQDEVTDALGEQVRRAVEMLIQALDRADVDRNRELLEGVEPTELYEAGLTVMMRIVFLLSAEERGLLLLGDERYEANYAVATLRMQLRGESEEILERRWDAWSRLLSLFRAVYGGIEHEALRLPALGGSLFDPDRFPFLEGRPKGTHWKTDPATPLPIDNRTVLLLLDAVQLFQGRTLSYRALDIEQIGYVYEGLLERTVVRAKEITLDLDATKNAKKPWVSLDELDEAVAEGDKAVRALLKERTGSSAGRIGSDLKKTVDETASDKLLTACHGNQNLRDRIRPYFHLLRIDRWGYPLVYPEDTFMVTTGTDRRETGTHYTPKPLTEAIVKGTLEPVAYAGPAEGKPREEWQLKSPPELLDLKICDPAMGSGAFLVQTCRWLSERLVEAWERSEAAGSAVTSEGMVVEELNGCEPLRNDVEERLLTARRLIAERCLYGVDVNPLAVELAKLSIWLVTLAKGRPFGFLDHNLRSGDSLLGIQNLDQLTYFDMNPGKGSSKKLFASKIDQAVQEAMSLRSDLRSRPINDIRDVEVMASLDKQARQKLELPGLIADALVGEALAANGKAVDTTALSIDAGGAMDGNDGKIEVLARHACKGLSTDLPAGKPLRRPFHWPLEYPEVFGRNNSGFDAMIGNPPFLGGQLLSGTFGSCFKDYLANLLTLGQNSVCDLVVFFFLRAFKLVRDNGYLGFLARRSFSEGKNREVGLSKLVNHGGVIYEARTNIVWPGKASMAVHQVQISKNNWQGKVHLNGAMVTEITSYLSSLELGTLEKLTDNSGRMFQGTILNWEGFKIDENEARAILDENGAYRQIIFPFIGGNEVNADPRLRPSCWVINFWDWPEEKAKSYVQAYRLIEDKMTRESEKKIKREEKNWWKFLRPRPDLYHAIGRGHAFLRHKKGWDPKFCPLPRVLAVCRGITKYPAFTFLRNDYIFSEKLYVLADDRYTTFAVLSSDLHTIWAWSQKTSLGDNLSSLSYTHGNIFEKFPLPQVVLDGVEDPTLSSIGEKFFEERSSYMIAHDKGLTKFYNDFHDLSVQDKAMKDCRNLQTQLSEEVLAAYGFDGVELEYGFHEVAYLPDGRNTRFTISEGAREEILRRLAILNKERHEQDIDAMRKDERLTSEKSNQPDETTADLFSAGAMQ